MSKIHTAQFRYFSCAGCNELILPGQQYELIGQRKYHFQPDCEHARSRHFDECVPALDEVRWKPAYNHLPRLLRSYSRIAEKDYTCDRCRHSNSVNQQHMSDIFAGSRYDAEVWVTNLGLEVRRYHDMCPWEPEYDRELERDLEEEEDEDLSEETEWSLPLAA